MYRKYPDNILKKLQETEMDMLCEFHNACQKYDIKYFVAGGTLLGCIRHGEMIPWDDDIDVGMLREEYDKFIEIFPQALGDKYEFIAPDTENRYYSFIPKVALKGTKYLKDLCLNAGLDDIGINIEIFVFENVNPDHKALAAQLKKVNNIKNLYISHQLKKPVSYDKFPLNIIKNTAKYILKAYTYAAKLDNKKLNRMFLNATVSSKETGWVTHFGDGTTWKNVIRKAEIYPLQKRKFRDFEVNIPNNYHQFLSQLYGNYMELPKEENRWNQAPVILKFPDGEEIDFRIIESEK